MFPWGHAVVCLVTLKDLSNICKQVLFHHQSMYLFCVRLYLRGCGYKNKSPSGATVKNSSCHMKFKGVVQHFILFLAQS